MITPSAKPRLKGMTDHNGYIANQPHPARENNQCNMEWMINPVLVENLLGFATLTYEKLFSRMHKRGLQ